MRFKDDSKAVKSLDQFKVGMTLWHVYGYQGAKPEAVEVMSMPFKYEDIQRYHEAGTLAGTMWITLWDIEGSYNRVHSLADCGIGDRYNNNRLFFNKQDALDFAAQ